MGAARADPELVGRIADWVGDGALALADLGYEGDPGLFRIPVKKPADATLTVDQQAYNAIHGALRCLGERANSLLKTHVQGPASLSRLSVAVGRLGHRSSRTGVRSA